MSNINPNIKDDIVKLYIAMFQRVPSQSEIDYWYSSAEKNNLIKNDQLDTIHLADTMADAAKNAVVSYNLEDIYPQYANYNPDNEDSVKAVINSVYQTIFNKDETQDPAGVQYWTDKIVKEHQSLGEVVVSMENAAEDIAQNPDKYQNAFSDEELQNALKAVEAFNTKVEAAEAISEKLPNVKVDSNTLEELQNLVKEIKDDNSKQIVLTYVDEHKEQFIPENSDLTNSDFSESEEGSLASPPQMPSLNEDSTELPLL